MDLRVIATNRVFYQVNPEIAVILLEAFPDKFERIAAQKPAEPVPTWGVGRGQYSGRACVSFKLGGRSERFDGPPEALVPVFQKMGIAVPEHIAKQYEALWTKPVGSGPYA